MKTVLYFAFAAFWHVTTVWGAHAQLDSSASSANIDKTDGTNAVRVIYTNDENEEAIISLAVATDGRLARHELFNGRVTKARVESGVHVTCFFYELYHLMYPFSTTKPLALSQTIATIRLYCYDSSAEEANNDKFVIFVEREIETKELLRVPLVDEEVAQLDLLEAFGDLGQNVKSLALIDTPKMDDTLTSEDISRSENDLNPGCIAVVSTADKFRRGGIDELEFSYEKRLEVYPARPLHELFCFMYG